MRRHFAKQTYRDNELDRFRFRIVFAAGAVLLAFILLIARFAYLQIIQHDYYTTRAEDNRISLMPIPPNRGLITDRNGVVLARNYSAFTLEITPSKVDDLETTIADLGKIIDIQPKDKRRFRKLMEESKSFAWHHCWHRQGPRRLRIGPAESRRGERLPAASPKPMGQAGSTMDADGEMGRLCLSG